MKLLYTVIVVLYIFCHLTHGKDEGSGDHDHFNLGAFDFFSEDNTEDDEHLQHHLKEDVGIEKNVENMTDSEKDWYYFKLHDTNEDMMLDGLELLKAWQHHYLEHLGHEGMAHPSDSSDEAQRKFVEQQNVMFIDLVDNILKEVDIDNNGYLDYWEYMMAKVKQREEDQKAIEKSKSDEEPQAK